MTEADWFDDRADRFFQDDAGCPNDPWTSKRACPHCLAELLRESNRIGMNVMRDDAIEVADDIFGADSGVFQRIKARLEDL